MPPATYLPWCTKLPRNATEPSTMFSPNDELTLVEAVLRLSHSGFPIDVPSLAAMVGFFFFFSLFFFFLRSTLPYPNHVQAVEVAATSYVEHKKRAFVASDTWVKDFLLRHPELSKRTLAVMETRRVEALTAPSVLGHLSAYERICAKYDVKFGWQVFNMNQSGTG